MKLCPLMEHEPQTFTCLHTSAYAHFLLSIIMKLIYISILHVPVPRSKILLKNKTRYNNEIVLGDPGIGQERAKNEEQNKEKSSEERFLAWQ